MAILRGRRSQSGHPILVTTPAGTPPSQVGNLTPGTPTTTTFPVTYTAATGSVIITYAGQTSIDGGATYVANGGTFTGTGGTFIGLTAATGYRLRIIATNSYGSSTTATPGPINTASAAASAFTIAISVSSGTPGGTVTLTATPTSGPWPVGEVITPSNAGLTGGWDHASATGSSTTPLAFVFTPTSGAGTSGVLSATGPAMTNSTGGLAYSVVAPAALTATRFDLILPASGAPSVSQSASLVPNATWPSGTVTLAATNATFDANSTGSITLTNPGTAATVTVPLTPTAAGPVTITATNSNTTLYNPMAQRLNCFASSAGTAQTLSATSRFSDLRGWQRNSFSSTPPGFNGTTFVHGHGRVWFTLNPGGSSGALYLRLYDGQTGSTTAGSGTLIQSAVQVYGTVAAGSQTFGINVGAVDALLWADFATDSAFTNPVRVAQRFKVGTLIHNIFRSQWAGLASNYAESTLPGATFAANTKGTSIQAHNSGSLGGATAWALHDGTTTAGGSATMPDDFFGTPNNSVGVQEMGRLSGIQFGVGVSYAGCTTVGGFQGFDSYIALDGTPGGGFTEGAAAADSEGRVVILGTNLWDSVAEAESVAGYVTRATKFCAWVGANMPNVATIIISLNSGTGNYLDLGGQRLWIGSDWRGWARLTEAIRNALAADPRVTTNDAIDWNEYVSGHAGHRSVMNYAHDFFWSLVANEPSVSGGLGLAQADQAATFAASGTRSTGSNLIKIPVNLPSGATGLVASGASYGSHDSWPLTESAPTAAALADLFACFNSGGSTTNFTTRYTIASATWNASTSSMDLLLTAGQSPAANLTVQAICDQPAQTFVASGNPAYGGDHWIGLYDNRTSLSSAGISRGPLIRPRTDISITTV